MKSIRFFPLLKNSILLAFGAGLLVAAPLRADLNSDLAFTAFSNVDVNALAGGQILQARGGLLAFHRAITAESLFIINATPTQVQDKLLHWNPATHSELKVWIHKSLPAQPTPADFSGLKDLPDNSSVDYLLNATANLDPANPALQLSKSEAQMIIPLRAQTRDRKALLVNFWSQVLAGRATRFLGGNGAADNYVISGGDIQPLSEIKSLFQTNPKVNQEYRGILGQTPVESSTKALPADIYYESFDVEGGATMGTGVTYQAGNGTSIQSIDIEYYDSASLYVSIELEQLWPITVNGKNETLVWRNDLVSTSNVAYLHGTERLASGMIMLQDVKQAINAFRTEFK